MRNTGVKTPHEIGQPTAMTVKTNLQVAKMARLRMSDGFDQRSMKSKGAAPKSSLITWRRGGRRGGGTSQRATELSMLAAHPKATAANAGGYGACACACACA